LDILLLYTDIYKITTGGGQAVIRKIIESLPENRFFYFIENEKKSVQRAQNAFPITLKKASSIKLLNDSNDLSKYEKLHFEIANQFARSANGKSFDIIEFPDYFPIGNKIFSVLNHHKIIYKKIIMSMHGNISSSHFYSMDYDLEDITTLQKLELEQFKMADSVYAISEKYANDYKKIFNRDIIQIDPLPFITLHDNLVIDFQNEKISLYSIGRTEKLKGQDLFIELLKWIDLSKVNSANIIGDEIYDSNGVSSYATLSNIATNRNIDVKISKSVDQSQLGKIFNSKSIIILPVRQDTLNLVALQAIFSGCPLVISSRAGICEYLENHFPGLPFIKIEFENFYGSILEINKLIRDYDNYRTTLIKYINKGNFNHDKFKNSLENVYNIYSNKGGSSDLNPIIAYKEMNVPFKRYLNIFLKSILPSEFHLKLISFKNNNNKFDFLKRVLNKYSSIVVFLRAVFWIYYIFKFNHQLKQFENEINKSASKINNFQKSLNRLFRFRFWNLLATNYDQITKDYLLYVTYKLRLFRLSKYNNDVDLVKERLLNLNFKEEAFVTSLLHKCNNSDVYNYLEERDFKHRKSSFKKWEYIYDNRQGNAKISIIVSLYNAASKLNFFLSYLVNQTSYIKGDVEIILVDSGSPTDEFKVYNSFNLGHKLNAVYARSENRETIQSAWNRGINLSKGEYLVFLGVDEALYPSSLEKLSNYLDKNKSIDWVMGNTLSTDVDQYGVFIKDKFVYNRSGATKYHVYLETCYLSWVSGMYRKSIHDNFGFYDEEFRASGDTEFKNRVLKNINVEFIDETLGVFMDYPEVRATGSPVAEVEDSRAWYLFRTGDGIEYLFEYENLETCINVFKLSICYRKSYKTELSSDLLFALNMAKFVESKFKNSAIPAEIIKSLQYLVDSIINLQSCEKNFTLGGYFRLLNYYFCKSKFKRRLRIFDEKLQTLDYLIVDNMFEQHSWIW